MMKASLGVALALALPLTTATATTTDATKSSTRPPTDLKKVGDHWTPWDPPEPPEGARVYVIVKGDTLWDLAQRDLSDPYLWPQIWDLNRYILDSHWIYPGDPLVMPGPVTVVAEETAPPEVEPGTGEGDGSETMEEAAMMPPPEDAGRPRRNTWIKPDPDAAADHSEMMCAGYILPERWQSDMFIYAGEEEHKTGFGPGDVVYMNQGLDGGVKPGDKFYVVHQEQKVKHPVTNDEMGFIVRKMAVVQVIAAQAETATLELIDGCDTVHVGYDLIRYSELTSPRKRDIDLERYGVEDNGNVAGYVIHTRDTRTAVGAGDIVYIDLGMADGLETGDYLMIYREDVTWERPNEAGLARWTNSHKSSIPAFKTRKLPRGEPIPRKMLGELIILNTNHHTATAKVMNSFREIYAGDQVQLLD